MLQQIADFAPNAQERERALKWLAFIESHIEGWPFGGENHSKSHWCRVLMLALAIADKEGLEAADKEALCAAAAFHDTRRRNAWPDQGHGKRAAQYYQRFCETRGLEYDSHAALAMAWHDHDDAEGLAAIAAWESAHPEAARNGRIPAHELYLIFKDADSLDRVRLPMEAFDTRFLRRTCSPALVPIARALFQASQGPGAAEMAKPGEARARLADETGSGQSRLANEPGAPRPYLVVVDVQNDFVDGALGTPEAQKALPAMVAKARSFPGQVVFTKDTHDNRYSETQEGRLLPVPHCLAGTHGWELAGEMDAIQREGGLPVYLKGSFGSTDLVRDLEAAYARGRVQSVEFIGLCTDICIASNALLAKAAMPQLPVYVDAACCAGVTPEKHDAALETMRSCQIRVR